MPLFARFVMPSVNLLASALVLSALGLSASACSDDPASATAEGATWKLTALGSALGGVQAHDPNSENPPVDFKVSCHKSSAGFGLSIEDPGRSEVATGDGDAGLMGVRTRSILKVTNIINGNCTVQVSEGPVGSAQIGYTGQCGDGCTISQTPAGPGFDFQGTLICAKVIGNSSGNEFSLGSSTGGPITLNLANCH